MRVESDLKLGFKDVLIRPKRSTLKSRSLVELKRTYTFLHSRKEWNGVPVIAANMDTVGTFEVAEVLAEHDMLCAIHKHYSLEMWASFLETKDESIYERIMVSTGVSDTDFKKLTQIIENHPQLSFICIDVANGYAEAFVEFVVRVRKAYPDKTIVAGNVVTGEVNVFKSAEVDFDSDDYVVEQVFYESKDGTRVPMFLSHRKDVVADGNRPTMLYGYGGFNLSQTPRFSITRLAWMEMGGVYAVANLRGGGEYGEEWHKAGTRLDKQNVFDDFIAAAEYLISENYTNPKKLAIFGGSNGGLLVGAVTNQRPELFAAAIPAVGVMDMLRFHEFTAGRFWVDDYGSSANADEFEALYAYSPYHNIKAGTKYPAVLITTADTDDRVVPGHSFKYAAAIQAAQEGDAPVLIRIETRAGHGAGVPTDKVIQAYADRWAFLVRNLDVRLPEGYGED